MKAGIQKPYIENLEAECLQSEYYTFEFSRPQGQRSLGERAIITFPPSFLLPSNYAQLGSFSILLTNRLIRCIRWVIGWPIIYCGHRGVAHLTWCDWYCGSNDAALDMAQGFWALLIPHGIEGGALSHITSTDDDDDDEEDEDEDMISGSGSGSKDDSGGWTSEHTQWWFDFLNEKGGKGISKDTWQMVSPSSRFLSLNSFNSFYTSFCITSASSCSWKSLSSSTRPHLHVHTLFSSHIHVPTSTLTPFFSLSFFLSAFPLSFPSELIDLSPAACSLPSNRSIQSLPIAASLPSFLWHWQWIHSELTRGMTFLSIPSPFPFSTYTHIPAVPGVRAHNRLQVREIRYRRLVPFFLLKPLSPLSVDRCLASKQDTTVDSIRFGWSKSDLKFSVVLHDANDANYVLWW